MLLRVITYNASRLRQSDMAHQYDLTRYFHGNRPEMMAFLPISIKCLLEIGCGQGNFSTAVANDRKCETWGIEAAPEPAAAARRSLTKVLEGDFYDQITKLPPKKFDCVVMNDVLEHLPDTDRALALISEVMTDDGTLVLSVPNVRHFSTMWRYVCKGEWNYEDAGVLDRTHLRFFTVKSLAQTLRCAGFVDISTQPINRDRGWKATIWRLIGLGFLNDTSFLQIAASCRRGRSN